jgi:TnpA family transposase
MPTRHLTETQRQSFARFDGDPSPEQLARYFHLDEIDREIIKGLRGNHNRLGFALMLGSARFLGVFPDARDEIPAGVLATLSEQLDLRQSVDLADYFKGSRRIGHLALIRARFGFTDFGENVRARCRLTRWLYALCWSGDDRPGPLIDRAASWLIVNKVLLPGITVLERLIGTVRDRARTRLWHRLVASLTDDQRVRIGRLFDDGDSSAFAALDALRTIPTKRTPTEFLRHLDRLDAVQSLPRADLDAAMAKIEAIAKPSETKPYAELRTRWRRARRLFFNIALRIETNATPGGGTVKATVDYLKTITDWSGAKMLDAPTAAVPKAWRQFALDQDGKVSDPRAYVFSVIEAWRGALKRRDVFAKPGIRYGDPRRGMLEGETWRESRLMVCRALGRSLDAAAEVDGLCRLLDEAYRKTAARAADNPDLRFEVTNGKSELIVTPLDRLDEPDSLRTLRPAVQGRMPKAGITDIFLEVMARTGFAQAFTHLSERQAKVENFEISLCAALVGEACNIGLEPLVRPEVPSLRRDRLSWVGQNFIRPETIAAANAVIVAAHSRLAIVGHWGAGETASADGMRFAAPASAIHAGPNPKYFGQARGVTWYNMISNQFSGLSGIVVPGTLRDSLMVLALLLEQETELEPLEIMTDTAAYSDAIFGLFWLLGYQFSPRLADIGGAKLWRIDRDADYGPFNAITHGTVNIGLIIENWGDLIRLAGSLKLGHLKAAGIMRTLQIKDRPTTLAKALAELGRIIKTLHILSYIDDKPFRGRILAQLNRQELRHKLGRRVHHGERGEIRSPLRQGQEEQLGALGLALNAIIHWNAIYMQEALRQLGDAGMATHAADIARLSPVSWRHINFLGRYEFLLPETVANGGLRPLRQPNSEWDF